MKIVYLHQYFTTPAMTGGTRSYEMARRLVSYGHEVHMVTSYRDDTAHDSWFETDEAGIRVHWLPVPYSNRLSYAQRIRAFFRFALAASTRASSIGCDVVFATSTPLTICLPAVYASKRLRVPMVFEVRDLWPELPIAIGALSDPISIALASRLERFAYRHASRIVALSPGMEEGIVGSGYPADRVTVIPNAADLSLFDVPESVGESFRERHEWLGHRPLVVYTGTIGRINGVGYLARVAAEADKFGSDVRFLVVGDGAERNAVRELAAGLGVLGKNFFMMGNVAKEEIPTILSAADLCTSLFIDLPAMWANSANKFFDSLAAGRPVAINYGGWQAEALARYEAGIRIPASDPVGAAEAIDRFLDREDLDQVGENARRLGVERFSRDQLAKKLEETLRAAANRTPTLAR